MNIFNDTTKDYGKHYQIRMSRNVYDGQDINYVNVDIETLKDIAIRSIRDGAAMLFAADVSHDQSGEHGIMADGVYNIIVHKKYVPAEILKIRDTPAILLPPWDPML